MTLASGCCECCGDFVGQTDGVIWHLDHCHRCGKKRGDICNRCNTALTEWLEDHWEAATVYLERHICEPELFDLTEFMVARTANSSKVTSRWRPGQGGDQAQTGIRASNVAGYVTVEQLAGVLGLAAGTIRDKMVGRRNGKQLVDGVRRVDGTVLIPHAVAFAEIAERWQITTP